MEKKDLPLGARRLIEELLDESNLGRKRPCGNYYFPMCRAARVRALQEDYEVFFPMDLPEPYLSEYYEGLNVNGNGDACASFGAVAQSDVEVLGAKVDSVRFSM